MRDNIYEYLLDFGFNKDILNNIEDRNDKIYFAYLKEVKDNIEFLLNKGLNKEDIILIINNNPYMLTIARNRREYYDNIYINTLKFNREELINLIKNNNYIYVHSPIELEKIINYLLGYTNIENIKKMIIDNPNIINMKLDKIKELLIVG